MTELRLAYGGPASAIATGLSDPVRKPALLVSYVYIKEFDRQREDLHFRDWVMDSGAFSAWKSGKTIDLDHFIDVCLERMETDPQLTEIFALDVIGDWRGGLANTEYMWKKGVPAIPTYHPGEPWDVLTGIAKDYPKIGLGATIGMKGKGDWFGQCFARVWPARIHGLGLMGEDLLMKYPFESVDAANWEMGPLCFGRWKSFGNAKLNIRGNHNLRPEVERVLKLEKRVKWRWRKQMAELEELKRVQHLRGLRA